MSIEGFIQLVHSERMVILLTGVVPDPTEEKVVIKRLAEKYPELELNPERERLSILHARASL